MSHPNTDRDERVREIRGRQERCMRPDRDDVPQRNADPLARELSRQLRQAQMDRGYLLSLLDSQAASSDALEWSKDWPDVNGFYWLRGWRHYADLPIKVDGDEFWMMFNLATNHRADLGDSEDVEFLGPMTPESINATRMRDRCVAKVKSMADEWQILWDKDLTGDHSEKIVYVQAANQIILALESLTLQGEQEKR